MRTARRIGIGVTAVVAAVAIGLIAWEPLAPPFPAPVAAPARSYDVRIVRDGHGVPHIFGAADPGVAYGLAFAHAEDDFGTLQEVFASVRGRSGAMLGEDGAKVDYAAHLLGIWRTVDRDYERVLAPDLRALLDGYAAGLNRYAERHPGEVRLRGLFPVTGRDVAAGFVLRSPFFYGLDRPLGALAENKPLPAEAGPSEERGSNAFAIAPARSGDGVTRLVSNSHQPWAGPVAWWEAVVHSRTGWDFAGALFPGSPYPLMGHNRTLGWTNTVNRPDLIDVYKLTLDESGERYRFAGKWRPLERTRVWLRVKLGPFALPVPRTVYRSVHGPVIVNDSGAYALRYAGFDDLRSVEAYYRLNRARNFDDWRAALARQSIAATNFVYADAAGNIGLFYNARFPKRAEGFDWRGLLPGDDPRALWKSYEPFAAAPAVVNPASGWVANANNTPFVATAPADQLQRRAYSDRLGIETYMPNRAHRFAELFTAQGDRPIGRDALLRIKFDKGYARTGWAGPWIAAVLAVDTRDAPSLQRAQALLRGWDWSQDGRGQADALAALVLKAAAGKAYRGEAMPEARDALVDAAGFLEKHYGRLDPPLSQLQRIRRGATDVAVNGGPDALRAIYSDRDEADGRLVANLGDSFVMLVEWSKDGQVRSWSVQPWGAAIERPGSRHYADQSTLFAAERLKPSLFDEAELRRRPVREYRP